MAERIRPMIAMSTPPADAAASDLRQDCADVEVRSSSSRASINTQKGLEDLTAEAAPNDTRDRIPERAEADVLKECAGNVSAYGATDQLYD